MEALDEFLRSQDINLDDLMDEEDRSKESHNENNRSKEQEQGTAATSSVTSATTNDVDGDQRSSRSHTITSSRQQQELLTESLIRNSFVGPKVVRLSMTYNSHRSQRRMFRAFGILFVVLLLSIYGFSRFNRILWNLSHEATLDIESKNIMAASKATSTGITTATGSSSGGSSINSEAVSLSVGGGEGNRRLNHPK